jgi:hypothetical protein
LVEEQIPATAYWNWVAVNRNATLLTQTPAVDGIRLQLAEMNATSTPEQQILELTLPGLNASGDTAYVVVSRTCGGMCGSGVRLLVARDSASGWAVMRRWDISY